MSTKEDKILVKFLGQKSGNLVVVVFFSFPQKTIHNSKPFFTLNNVLLVLKSSIKV